MTTPMEPLRSPFFSLSQSPSAGLVSFQDSAPLVTSPGSGSSGWKLNRPGYQDGRTGSMVWTSTPGQSPPAAATSFRESTHLIPSPGFDGTTPKRFRSIVFSWPVAIGVPLCLLLLGFAVEVAVIVCMERNGFSVPRDNPFPIVSPQFLLSFLPVLIVIPFALLWRELDWNVRWFQPYVVLKKGNAAAGESLLLNYVASGPFLALFRSKYYEHQIVFWSSLVAVATYSFQPLAASIFQIRERPWTESNYLPFDSTSVL